MELSKTNVSQTLSVKFIMRDLKAFLDTPPRASRCSPRFGPGWRLELESQKPASTGSETLIGVYLIVDQQQAPLEFDFAVALSNHFVASDSQGKNYRRH